MDMCCQMRSNTTCGCKNTGAGHQTHVYYIIVTFTALNMYHSTVDYCGEDELIRS
jgi:hypothetical protein